MPELPEGFIDVSVLKDGGILKKVLKDGVSDEYPPDGVEVEVHYVGTIYGGEKDGEKFDSSRDRGDHFKFKIGEGQVIKAWDQGVSSMKRGEIAELICAPSYAYGEAGSGEKIPSNSTLKFEVELFGWKGKDVSPDNDGTITESTVKKGEKYEHPKDCAKVTVHILGNFDGQTFLDNDYSFEIGEAVDMELPLCVDHLVKKMKKNQISKFEIHSKHAWGSKGCSKYNIPPNAAIVLTIELKEFEVFKETYGIDSNSEKFEYTEYLKNRGTEKIKQLKYDMAFKLYEQASKYIQYESDFKEEEDKDKWSALRLALHLNKALCQIKLCNSSKAISECDEALGIDGNSEKAHFRKGQACAMRCDFEDAIVSFQKVIEIQPNNSAASVQIAFCKKKLKDMANKEKNLYKHMMANIKLPAKISPTKEQNGEDKACNGKTEEVDTPNDVKMDDGDVKA